MSVSLQRIKNYIHKCDFRNLFIDELGWDQHSLELPVAVDGRDFQLHAVAQKRGFQVFECHVDDGAEFPLSAMRNRIARQTARSAHEHLIIFTNDDRSVQVWQRPDRIKGSQLKFFQHEYRDGQPGESLAQKVREFAVSLDEEESLTLVDVLERARSMRVERVTRRFYDQFKREHTAFLSFVKGITDQASSEWYASLMLNRLMFVYFIQKKGCLDGNTDYLRDRLNRSKEAQGKDKFHSFYRHFLLRLFHEGLGTRVKDREPGLDDLIGDIPYLNGGLFDVHDIEETNPKIRIADEAFERLFDFFDAYQWHLDDRPVASDDEINPDVLGYIFEKYINQKQMGAYYTKEDITEYISRNTIVPFLFDAAQKKCAAEFEADGPVWRLLIDDPDRYIFDAVGHGVFVNIHTGERLAEALPLPDEIAAGLDDNEQRACWNQAAPDEYALTTETWREVVARRKRCEELRRKLSDGQVTMINDLITLNLDLNRFAEDVIRTSESSSLLKAFYVAIAGRQPRRSNERFQHGVSVLDPTCGSGAFLFAALNILEPLYEACLDRMQEFLADQERLGDGGRKFAEFREIIEQIGKHPSRRYFVFKSIIINNLYGVDIMPEAVEICKLRLFLKLVSQVDRTSQLEPLPDIDFNIRAGNTLVGFASLDEVRATLKGTLGFSDTKEDIERIEDHALTVEKAYNQFRLQHTRLGGHVTPADKKALRTSLETLTAELNEYLASEYGVDPTKPRNFKGWLLSHAPFHWFAEFFGIMLGGGFDCVIGNPPYIQLREVRAYQLRGFDCVSAGNLYALMLERCQSISSPTGRQGYIVPVSSVSTDGYSCLQQVLTRRDLHFASFDDRPSRLFDGLQHIRLTIHLLGSTADSPSLCSTRYNKWRADERSTLFDRLCYVPSHSSLVDNSIPKFCSEVEHQIVSRLEREPGRISDSYDRSGNCTVFYSRKVGYFLQVLDFEPLVLDGDGNRRPPSEFKTLRFGDQRIAELALCCLNSNLFYWFITAYSDCRHLNKREVDSFPVDLNSLAEHEVAAELLPLARQLMSDLQDNSDERTMRFKHDTLTVQCIIPKHSKPLIDEIDRLLACYFGFDSEQRDFITAYDLKYRVGTDEDD